MKCELEPHDIEAIAECVVNRLRPLLATAHEESGDPYLTVKELAEHLKVSPQWVYDRVRLNEIPFIKIRGHVLFDRARIDKWLSSHSTPAAATPSRILDAVRRRASS